MPGIAAVWTPNDEKHGGYPGLSRALYALDCPGSSPPAMLSEGACSMGSVLQSFLPEDAFSSPLPDNLYLMTDCRLDNRAELADVLSLRGPDAISDHGLMVAAWLRWGEDCLRHLVGAFSLAVWQPEHQLLFAARDPVGEYPLCYFHSRGLIAVASRPKALLALDGIPVRFNERHIADWLSLNPPTAGSTFFADLFSVPPGCAVRLTREGAEVRRYWHPMDARPVRFRSDDEYAEGMRAVLDRATGARLRSLGQASAQLSSGLDSSSVASSAALQLLPLGRELTAYTAVPQRGFSGWHRNSNIYYDEGPFAAEVAAMYPNIRHVRVDSEGLALLPTVCRWVDAMDEPVLNGTNIVWIDTILRRASEAGSDILFQGSMGNGNISYETLRIFADFLRQGRWIALGQAVYRHRASGFMSFRQAARAAFQDFYPERLSSNQRKLREAFSLDFSAINPHFAEETDVFAQTLARHTAREPNIADERRLLYERFDFGLLNLASRSLHGVEPRDPTYDKLVWEYTYAIPVDQFVVEGHSRSLIRRAMRGRLPEKTLARYGRGRQGADWYYNLRAALPALREELEEQERSPAARRFLDLPRLKSLVETFPEADFDRARVFNPYHYALLRGVTLGYFLRTHDPALEAG